MAEDNPVVKKNKIKRRKRIAKKKNLPKVDVVKWKSKVFG